MGSSREIKTDFAPIEPAEILNKLVELPVLSWRFKKGAQDSIHLGPVAEDFFSAFGLGSDEKHISSSDTTGVAFAAIQALNAQVESVQQQNQRLKAISLLALGASAIGMMMGLAVLRRSS